jgi:hypothetical protein
MISKDFTLAYFWFVEDSSTGMRAVFEQSGSVYGLTQIRLDMQAKFMSAGCSLRKTSLTKIRNDKLRNELLNQFSLPHHFYF